jgi:CheY-like chemotaxis protein
MSHELRTPLNAVIGFSEVLLDRMFGEINERQEEYLRDILSSGRHLLELINDVLDLSKVEAGQMVLEPSTFEVSSALEWASALHRERAAAHAITVTSEVAEDVGTIEADERQFRQVVLNLVANAVKFTPDGGSVSINACRDGTELNVTVTDTGIGVAPEDQERIFETFQQGRRGAPKEEGTGLGLTLCRKIVALFGGRMWLESTPGVGSTFGFSVPGQPEQEDEIAFPERDKLPVVVLVDDDRASLDLLSAYLDGSGTRVLRARDGVEALEQIRKVAPVAVVLDIKLPRLDGWEVLAELKADPTTAAIPVVIASVVDDRPRGLAEGADEYLLKPIRRDELVDALRRLGALAESS